MYEGLYLHIPFCTTRCGYCDFNTYEDRLQHRERYVAGLEKEVRAHAGKQRRGGLKTMYFGGGTPSLLEPEQVSALVQAARRSMGLKKTAEITLEANPSGVDEARLKAYREAGVNRLSFGFQAAQDHILKDIDREHGREDCERAWAAARSAGFDNMSLDLMFGLPNQSMEDWEHSLEWALGLEPEHISFYGLTVEAGTPFAKRQKMGQLPLPNDDLQADMYLEGIERLSHAGLQHYEISNFGRPDRQSLHNRLYWENQPTLGLGAGAWSFDGQRRFGRVRLPEAYADRATTGEATDLPGERLEGEKALGETAMLGLRLLEGIRFSHWRRRTGREWMDDFGALSLRLSDRGLLKVEKDRVRLAQAALPLANEVFSEFV